jgi:hypothetical protein
LRQQRDQDADQARGECIEGALGWVDPGPIRPDYPSADYQFVEDDPAVTAYLDRLKSEDDPDKDEDSDEEGTDPDEENEEGRKELFNRLLREREKKYADEIDTQRAALPGLHIRSDAYEVCNSEERAAERGQAIIEARRQWEASE